MENPFKGRNGDIEETSQKPGKIERREYHLPGTLMTAYLVNVPEDDASKTHPETLVSSLPPKARTE